MLGRIWRALRGWGRRGAGPRSGEADSSGRGAVQAVERRAEEGVRPALDASSAAFAHRLGSRMRLGVVRRAMANARNVAISAPRPLAAFVAPGTLRDVSREPLPLVGAYALTPEVQEAREEGQGPDAAWEALWALRGTPRVSGDASPSPGGMQPSVAEAELRPARRVPSPAQDGPVLGVPGGHAGRVERTQSSTPASGPHAPEETERPVGVPPSTTAPRTGPQTMPPGPVRPSALPARPARPPVTTRGPPPGTARPVQRQVAEEAAPPSAVGSRPVQATRPPGLGTRDGAGAGAPEIGGRPSGSISETGLEPGTPEPVARAPGPGAPIGGPPVPAVRLPQGSSPPRESVVQAAPDGEAAAGPGDLAEDGFTPFQDVPARREAVGPPATVMRAPEPRAAPAGPDAASRGVVEPPHARQTDDTPGSSGWWLGEARPAQSDEEAVRSRAPIQASEAGVSQAASGPPRRTFLEGVRRLLPLRQLIRRQPARSMPSGERQGGAGQIEGQSAGSLRRTLPPPELASLPPVGDGRPPGGTPVQAASGQEGAVGAGSTGDRLEPGGPVVPGPAPGTTVDLTSREAAAPGETPAMQVPGPGRVPPAVQGYEAVQDEAVREPENAAQVAGHVERPMPAQEAALSRESLSVARPGDEGHDLRRGVREVVQRAAGLAQRVAGRRTAISQHEPSAVPFAPPAPAEEQQAVPGQEGWTSADRPARPQPIRPLVMAGSVQRRPAERQGGLALTPGASFRRRGEVAFFTGSSSPGGRGEVVVQRAVGSLPDLRQALQPTLAPADVQAARSGEAAPGPATEEATGEEAGSQDVEVMAQEVYRIIRRRLAVERERERGRT